MISVQHNLDALNSILPEYARVRGWTTTQVLVSKGSQLAFALSQEMRKLSPGRGGDFMASMDEKPVGIFANLRNGQEALLEEAGVTPDGFDDVTWTEIPPADGADGARKAG